MKPKKVKEELIKANRSRVEVENEKIEGYISRRNWEMNESGTGLRYMIYKEGSGENAKAGMIASVKYNLSLLDGTNVYASEDGPESFRIGMDDIESGIHEGITYMNVGSKAKLILPAHLAFGLLGDQNKIPSNATLVYDIELVELKN